MLGDDVGVVLRREGYGKAAGKVREVLRKSAEKVIETCRGSAGTPPEKCKQSEGKVRERCEMMRERCMISAGKSVGHVRGHCETIAGISTGKALEIGGARQETWAPNE